MHIDVSRLDGEVIEWSGSNTTTLATLKDEIAQRAESSAPIRLLHGEEELTENAVAIGYLLPPSEKLQLSMVILPLPAVLECSQCDWVLGGFTCAKCESLLYLDADGKVACPGGHGSMNPPQCCSANMKPASQTAGTGLTPAKRRESPDQWLSPCWECEFCKFGVIGVLCMQCNSHGEEIRRNGFFERVCCSYVWTCPKGCARKKEGGVFHEATVLCGCDKGNMGCPEYYARFGPPMN